MNVNVHIERLVLEGLEVAHANRPALQAAVEGELARLIFEGGLSPALRGGGDRPALDAGSFEMRAGGDLMQIGGQIGRAVYQEVGQ